MVFLIFFCRRVAANVIWLPRVEGFRWDQHGSNGRSTSDLNIEGSIWSPKKSSDKYPNSETSPLAYSISRVRDFFFDITKVTDFW